MLDAELLGGFLNSGGLVGSCSALDPRRFALQPAQIIELRAPHISFLHDLNRRNHRRMQRENPLHANPKAHTPHREARARGVPAPFDHHALKRLDALFFFSLFAFLHATSRLPARYPLGGTPASPCVLETLAPHQSRGSCLISRADPLRWGQLTLRNCLIYSKTRILGHKIDVRSRAARIPPGIMLFLFGANLTMHFEKHTDFPTSPSARAGHISRSSAPFQSECAHTGKSNRYTRLLESPVSYTKQKAGSCSNRYKIALFRFLGRSPITHV